MDEHGVRLRAFLPGAEADWWQRLAVAWRLAADLDALDDLAASSRIFRHNRFALIAFHDRAFGPRDGPPLARRLRPDVDHPRPPVVRAP